MSTSLAQHNFLSPEIVENPFEANAAARREAPVYQLPGSRIFMISTYDLITEACSQPAVFSNGFNAAFRRILARMKNLRLGEDNDLKHHSNLLLRGLKKLNIEFDRI
jgi:cytochrome P450